ncbi:MAG TPA: GGDEF domain-containing protein [Candidatus Binatia bacterium]|nr:GGDEF domain-containing protein [Candidatus Binatia bacterium]
MSSDVPPGGGPQQQAELAPGGDRYALQRRKGFPWLVFFPDLETEFRASFVEVNRWRIRVGASVGMAGCFGFIFLDQVLGQNLSPLAADLMLVCVTVPSLLVTTWSTFRPQTGSGLLRSIQIASLLVGFSILGVICIGRATHPWFPYDSLLLVTVYIFFVSGLLYYQAIFCSAVLWVAFVATNALLQRHDVLIYEAFYLALANALAWLGMYVLEFQARNAFLLERELSLQAQIDSLTGALNRRAFRGHLETAWRQAQRERVAIGIMLIDLDGFKAINDTGGHPFGDHALQRVAQVLKDGAHRPLDAVGRYGGDEFIALWFGVDPSWFEQLARDLPKQLADLSCGDASAPLRVGISGGAVLAWPQPGMSPDDAIHAADRKLYEMKRTGRGTIQCVRMAPPAAALRA